MRNPFTFYKGKRPHLFLLKENGKYKHIRPEELGDIAFKKEQDKLLNRRYSGENILETFLSLTLDNYHTPAEAFMKKYLKNDEIITAKEFCKKLGLISKDEEITVEGLNFLNLIQNKRIARRQFWTNTILTIATTILAIIAILSFPQ